MNFGATLTRALAITWRHRYLWLLALLAGEGEAYGLDDVRSVVTGRNRAAGPSGTMTRGELAAWVAAHAALIWTAALALGLLLVVLLLVSAVASGAVIRAAAEHDRERPFGLRMAWRAGIRTWWPVLQMKLVAVLVTLGLLATIGSLVAVAVVGGMGGHLALAVGAGATAAVLLLLVIPGWIVFEVAVLLAMRAIVLDGRRPRAALSAGFGLIRRRPGRVALTWLLVAAAAVVGGVAIGIAVVIVALPLGAAVAGAYVAGGISAAVAAGVVAGLAWLAVALTLSGALDAFTSTFWTLAYLRFDQEPRPVTAGMPQPA